MDYPTIFMPLETPNPQKTALLTVLVSVGLVIQLLPRPPNVEFTSFFSFIVGVIFGWRTGVICGGFIMFVNAFLSPWGFAGLNMPFQMLGMTIAGMAGGIYRRYLPNLVQIRFFAEAAILGAFIGLVFSIITNVGVAFSFIIGGMPPPLALFSALAWGAPFILIHVVSNTVVFGVLFIPLMNALNKFIGGAGVWLKREP